MFQNCLHFFIFIDRFPVLRSRYYIFIIERVYQTLNGKLFELILSYSYGKILGYLQVIQIETGIVISQKKKMIKISL